MDYQVDITQEEVLQLAKEYLGTGWDQLQANQVKISVLSGGVCSRLYIIDNDSNGSVKCEPERFLCRLYGGRGTVDDDTSLIILNVETQLLMFYEFGRLGLGPQLYGSFKGGRLEEFIPSRTLSDADLKDPCLRKEIARKLAHYHNAKFPYTKKVQTYYDVYEEFYLNYETEESQLIFKEVCETLGMDPNWASDYDWRKEIRWIREMEPKIRTRMVLSNNDMNRNNCLIRNEPDRNGDRVMLIDYELSAVTSRGSDIGHHFLMWLLNPDFKTMSFESSVGYPSDDTKREFIAEYLRETEKIAAYPFETELDSVDHLLMESEFFGMKVMQFWIANFFRTKKEGPLSNIHLRMLIMKIAKVFMDTYYQQKKHFIEKYNL